MSAAQEARDRLAALVDSPTEIIDDLIDADIRTLIAAYDAGAQAEARLAAVEALLLVPRAQPRYGDLGLFLGFDSTGAGEHRTVGEHRAWCHDCRQWCYPQLACYCCEPPIGPAELRRALAAPAAADGAEVGAP